MKKTNAMRILEAEGIPYICMEYEWDEEAFDAVSTARKLELDIDSVFKTIVTQSETNEIFVFCIPASATVCLKKAKTLIGCKLTPVKQDHLQKITGYVRGGCSPIGMKKHFSTVIDETAELYDRIYVSAGERGKMLGLSPVDLQHICSASFYPITE